MTPGRQPNVAEALELFRSGLGMGRDTLVVRIAHLDELEALAALVSRHGFDRVTLESSALLPTVLLPGLELHTPTPGSHSEVVRAEDLLAFVDGETARFVPPPFHPDLQARLDAAAVDGVISDPDLADEAFAAMVAQEHAMRAHLPPPVIESGRAFPSLGDDAPALE